MSKSVYSLVLDDELVGQLDRAAYARGQSRSALINEIVAQYLSCTTPEMRAQQALVSAQRLLGESGMLQLVAPPSGGGMTLRSALRYKYNPTVRYSIELFSVQGEPAGRLRAVLRTRSEMLLSDAQGFFVLWDGLERRMLGPVESQLERGRYVRLFRPVGAGVSAQALGECIADYVSLFDRSLRLYFENLDDEAGAASEIARLYGAWLRSPAQTI